MYANLWKNDFADCVIGGWNKRNSMFSILLYFMEKGDTVASSNKTLVPTKQGIGIQRSTVLRSVFARSEETER